MCLGKTRSRAFCWKRTQSKTQDYLQKLMLHAPEKLFKINSYFLLNNTGCLLQYISLCFLSCTVCSFSLLNF